MLSADLITTVTTTAFLFLGMALTLTFVIVGTRWAASVFLTVGGVLTAAMLITVAVVPLAMPTGLSLIFALLGSAVAVAGGNPVTRHVLHLATKGTVREGEHGGILLRMPRQNEEPAVMREVLLGGTTIGYLERLAAALTIIAGFPEGIAVIVALKGIGRFSELASAEARERFIIGTLASLAWACVVAGTVILAMR